MMPVMQGVDDPELAAALAMSMEDYGGASEAAPPTTSAAPVRCFPLRHAPWCRALPLCRWRRQGFFSVFSLVP